ncbi:MAG TPA: VTT domain-containing protein [Acetobacteraceae bacterium]|nr:VTT domain-containing protein [Acetobacteraceae bacterium]
MLLVPHIAPAISADHGDPVAMAAMIARIGRIGWVPFLLAQLAIVISGVLPASIVGIAAGLVYGFVPGLALAAVSVLAGALIAFLLGRSLLRRWIAPWVERHGRFKEFDRLVSRDGWKIVCLLRASPVMPFAATSYGLALSSISTTSYLVGTFASLPALAGFVLAGALARHGLLAPGWQPLQAASIVLGAAATLLLTVRLGWFMSRCGLLGTSARPT